MKTFNILKSVTSLIVLGSMASCTGKFNEINTNPNGATVSRADWLATSLITAATTDIIGTQKTFLQPYILGKYLIYTEFQENYQYNKLTRGDFDRLTSLRNVPLMLEYATDSVMKYSYQGLGHFIRAYQFFQTTIAMGDIPYSDAITGESKNNVQPIYDTQKEVFQGVIKELDSADYYFAKGSTFSGDIVFGGDPSKWRKLSNGFELHVLNTLYKKTSDTDLGVAAKFASIVSSRPLMESYADNFAITYQNAAGNCYPWSNTNIQKNPSIIYTGLSSTLIDLLKSLQDRRLFYYAEPAKTKTTAGVSSSSYEAYQGAEPSAEYSSITTAKAAGNVSDFNNRYLELYNAEPVSLYSYWDQEFILAEATIRGWISGNSAQTYYANGIRSSMDFHADYTPTSSGYNHNVAITDDYVAQYISTVALTGSSENQIKQIITQKYLAGFLQGNENNAWFENRRTGYPTFVLNSSTNLNDPTTQFPLRWMYPQLEYNQNSANVAAAVQSQFGGNDDVNQQMWILK